MPPHDLLPDDGPNPWRTLARDVPFESPVFRVRVDEVVQPDGSPGTYTYVEVPHPVVAMVALDDHDDVHLVRQWRYPWARNSWEIPAGHADGGEPPLQAAQRELAEEAGFRAARWESLGTGYASAAIAVQIHYFLARDITPAYAHRDASEQDMLTRAVPFADALEAALTGQIVHAISVVGLVRAARNLGIFAPMGAPRDSPSASAQPRSTGPEVPYIEPR